MTQRLLSLCFLPLILLFHSACGGGGGGHDSSGLRAQAEPFVTGFTSFPVDIASESDERLFVAELSGSLRLVQDRVLAQEPVLTVQVADGGGLYGVALSPDFRANHRLFIYYTDRADGRNRVTSYIEQDGIATIERDVITGIPAGGHDGGKMAFLRDGTLLITTGDAGDPALSQDLGSLAGKILRVNEDGSIPDNNPFSSSPTYALGFRNLFGLALSSNEVYVADNGPDCDDEVNVISPSANYGWRPGQSCGDEDPAFALPALRISSPIGITGLTSVRNSDFDGWDGDLLYGDFNVGNITRVRIEAGVVTAHETVLEMREPTLALHNTKRGELFFTTGSTLYRMVQAG